MPALKLKSAGKDLTPRHPYLFSWIAVNSSIVYYYCQHRQIMSWHQTLTMVFEEKGVYASIIVIEWDHFTLLVSLDRQLRGEYNIKEIDAYWLIGLLLLG